MDPSTRLISLPASLEDVRIKTLPSSAFYIADFITEREEQTLLDKIKTAPKPRWKQLSKRRLQTWPSDLINGNTLLDTPLPQWLQEPVLSRLLRCLISDTDAERNIFSDSPHGAPNMVLINEYLPGQGIMPHKDGAAYYPVVCTVSLGASLCLGIYGNKQDGAIEKEPRWKILQEPRSLLITTAEIYTDYLHGIAETKEEIDLGPETISNWSLLRSPDELLNRKFERQTRISLTCRDVIKVSKLGSKFGMLGKR